MIWNFILIAMAGLPRDVVPFTKINGHTCSGLLNGKVLIFLDILHF